VVVPAATTRRQRGCSSCAVGMSPSGTVNGIYSYNLALTAASPESL